MLATKTPGTQIKPFPLAVNDDCSWLDIRQPASLGILLGVAYLIAKMDCFSAKVAFSSQIVNSFFTSQA